MSGTSAQLNSNTWDVPPIAFVDAQFGNDATGIVGDGNKPFQTVATALSKSDWVTIKPCLTSETIGLSGAQLDNKHIHCMDGVEFTDGGLFISGNQITRAWFTGRAIFTGGGCNLVRIVSSDVELDFECAYASNARQVVFTEGSSNNTNPTVRFKADWIRANCFNGAGYAVRVIGGSKIDINIALYFESQHDLYHMRGNASGSLTVTCPINKIIPNYTSSYGNTNKSVVQINNFSRGINVTINGDCISTHDSAGTGINDSRAILEINQITDADANPTVTINGNLDNLLSPCINTGFRGVFGKYIINGNLIARNVAGGYGGTPIYTVLSGYPQPGSATFIIKDSIISGSTRIVIGRGRIFSFIQSSFKNLDIDASESAFFLEQSGNLPQRVFLYNCYVETPNGGVTPELIKGNSVGAIVGTVNTQGNVPFGITYADIWGAYINQPALIVPQIN